ncbi:PAS domain-containing hybrid sensor histidine kinase/response regulator [Parabacteroides bouchesdurhonensis]|uniref:PAS domain-containing hybrid sensor histidine kinase/response regulator n=1 Tax=Parabacteroides bouchesdurhonensis TaxID=1936995 RepID=UPI000E524182|nr:PAS domain-containing hybrid sensor histidine kinase/response regulator [Parabacteroides bouchesdurhonensis]RHJ91141.1 response regulator [Bacteroides sp. AM07-16]
MITNYSSKIDDSEYSTFMSMMNVGISKNLFDEHFTVIWANDYYYEMIGYSKEEYETLYHNHVDEYYKEDSELLAEISRYVLDAFERKESTYKFECKMHIKGGKYRWMWVVGRFTDEEYGGCPVIYTVYTDITHQKEMQAQLEERSNLLHDALEAAECANRAKSDFLSRMSHDIRTPMNAIIGMTDIASSYLNNPEKIKDCLKKISLSSQYLLGLINDVLDMSKIESGKMSLNKDCMSLPDLLENVVTIIQPSIKAKHQQFSIRLKKVKHEQFVSDALRLRQVFINILSNAVKFTPEGGSLTFDIEESVSDRPGFALFKFIFTDTGIGIKPEFMDHIFDAFTREKDSRVDKAEGSGLGLAISKKIVDMLEGDIQIISEVGKGTSFIVTIPLQISDTEEELLEEVSFPGLKIMVVDDDEIMCEYMVQMLKKIEIQADWASDSGEAITRIKDNFLSGKGYDAVILDWQMPGMDGIAMARLIRKYTRNDLPVIVISAYDWSDIEDDAKLAGVNGFLSKPVFMSTLCRGIKKYVLKQSLFVSEQTKRYDFTGKRFLLAEDNELNREIAIEILSSIGATIDYACDGAEAVKKFEQSPEYYYDLILMDIQMPVMNGYAAARKIRELSRKDSSTIPILAMTADAFSEDIKAAKDAGMNSHLAKPLDIATMNREINKFLNQST